MWTDDAARLFGVHVTPEQARLFDLYLERLLAANEQLNLTGITEPDAVQVRHFLDSLSVVLAAPPAPAARVVDVGTGAGFPGLPLAMVFPQLQVTLLDSTQKKLDFLNALIREMNVKSVRTVHMRAEDAGQNPAHRERYDLVLARAVARLPVLLEYLLPLAKVGGVVVAMKGETAQQEADDSTNALATLRGELVGITPVTLPGVEHTHNLVVVRKTEPTPRYYPRAAGTPAKKPL